MIVVTRQLKWTQDELDKMSPLGQVDYLVVHHTESGDVPVEEIDRWHKEKGWIGVGYHYVIRANGDIEKGRPDIKEGAHALGHNHDSLGVVLTGNFMNTVPTAAQMDSLVGLLSDLQGRYPAAKVVKHRDLCETSCPGDKFPWDELQVRLLSIAVIIKAGGKSLTGKLIGDVSYAPVRALAEALGHKVTWDETSKTVSIS